MSKFQGPVLKRNRVDGIQHTTHGVRTNSDSERLPDLDPLTCPISQWRNATNSPLRLVSFYFAQMRRIYDEGGQPWAPPLGCEYSTYLKAAKELLDAGPTIAIRTILWALSVAQHPPSLQWIASKSTEVQECLQINSTIPTRSGLGVMSLL